jgi:hypothetical protein
MAWNSLVDGDWSKADFTKAPWVGGVMTLTHEEVLRVQTEVAKIIEAYVPAPEYSYSSVPPDNEYIVPKYNQSDWEKCINGDTYAVIKGYDPDVHTLGIDANGIVQAAEETPVEESPVEVGEE